MISRDQATRSATKWAALPPDERAAYDVLEAAAPVGIERDSLKKALGAGRTVVEITAFAAKIRDKDETWLRDNLRVTGSSTGKGIQQQFHMSCNATTVQAVRAELDPIYALQLHEENDARGAPISGIAASATVAFAAEQRRMLETADPEQGGRRGVAVHRKAAAAAGVGHGRFAVDLLDALAPTTGLKFTPTPVTAADRPAAVASIATELAAGRPVPLVVGNAEGDTSHYVAAVAVLSTPAGTTFYIHDPGTGTTVAVTEADMKNNTMALPSGWNRLVRYEKPVKAPPAAASGAAAPAPPPRATPGPATPPVAPTRVPGPAASPPRPVPPVPGPAASPPRPVPPPPPPRSGPRPPGPGPSRGAGP